MSRDPAAARFAVLQLVRLAGTLLVLGGVLVLSGRVGWPQGVGYGLAATGLAAFFALPLFLAKRWKSKA